MARADNVLSGPASTAGVCDGRVIRGVQGRRRGGAERLVRVGVGNRPAATAMTARGSALSAVFEAPGVALLFSNFPVALATSGGASNGTRRSRCS
jgi:hypothetical protein